MSDSCKCTSAITAAFEEAALALGGVAATYPMPDDAVWDLARSLDLIHQRACEKCGAVGVIRPEEPEDTEHPAIAHLLAQLNRTRSMDRGPGR